MTGRHSRTGLAVLGLPLFGGPMLAGLAGHDMSVLPVFAALFLLYTAATRKPDLATGAGWAGLVLMAGLQVVLVLAAYGVGRMLADIIGPVALPIWAPLSITAAAAGLGGWAMRDAAEMDVMLADALKALDDLDRNRPVTDLWPAPSSDAAAAVARALTRLRALEAPTPGAIDPIVATLWEEAQIAAFDPLYDAAGVHRGASDVAVDLGLLRFVASPRARHLLIERGEAGLAPMLLLAAPDPVVRAEVRARLGELMADATPAAQLPDAARLAELAQAFPGEGFEDLIAIGQEL